MSLKKAMIYIVEDDLSFRKSLERLIKALGYEFLSFDSANSFLAHGSMRRPACLLLDVHLPGIDGMDLQQELIARGINLPVIFMTGHGSIPMSVQAMKNGAEDFLPKPFETADLKRAILKALERDGNSRKQEIEVQKCAALIDTLTPREKEVLTWVITGKLNKQIAAALGTSEKTIKAHRACVMHKTGMSSVADLVRLVEKVNISPAR